MADQLALTYSIRTSTGLGHTKELYSRLRQPPLRPPAWVFGPVWTVLYWNDGLRGPPRNSLHDPPHASDCSSLFPNIVHDAAGPQLPLDAVILWCAQTWVGPCGYCSSGWYGRQTDGNVVGFRSHCVLDDAPVCRLALLCGISECKRWVVEQLGF